MCVSVLKLPSSTSFIVITTIIATNSRSFDDRAKSQQRSYSSSSFAAISNFASVYVYLCCMSTTQRIVYIFSLTSTANFCHVVCQLCLLFSLFLSICFHVSLSHVSWIHLFCVVSSNITYGLFRWGMLKIKVTTNKTTLKTTFELVFFLV